MLRRQILALHMLNMDAGDSRIGQHSWEEQRGKKETIVSTFNSFSDLFQSIITFWREKGTLLSLKREIIMRQWLCPLHLIKLCLVNSHAKKKSADFNVGSDVWWAILRRFDPWLWYHTFNFLLLI